MTLMNRTPLETQLHSGLPARTQSGAIPGSARLLGYSGVIPFAICAALFAWGNPEWQPLVLEAFLVYGAVILSFIGGIRWGAAISGGRVRRGQLVMSVLPSLWAATFLLLPNEQNALIGLMTGFLLLGMADWARPALGMPAWMRPLRARLTLAVMTCHLALVFAQ